MMKVLNSLKFIKGFTEKHTIYMLKAAVADIHFWDVKKLAKFFYILQMDKKK